MQIIKENSDTKKQKAPPTTSLIHPTNKYTSRKKLLLFQQLSKIQIVKSIRVTGAANSSVKLDKQIEKRFNLVYDTSTSTSGSLS